MTLKLEQTKKDLREGRFTINGMKLKVGYSQIALKGNKVSLIESLTQNTVASNHFRDWINSSDNAYETKKALMDDLKHKIFFRI